MPITGLNVLNTFHHTSKADRWIEAKNERHSRPIPFVGRRLASPTRSTRSTTLHSVGPDSVQHLRSKTIRSLSRCARGRHVRITGLTGTELLTV